MALAPSKKRIKTEVSKQWILDQLSLQMIHTLLLSVLDGGKGSNNSLVIGDGLAVEGDIEVNADEDALVLEVEVSNRELVDERHDGFAED